MMRNIRNVLMRSLFFLFVCPGFIPAAQAASPLRVQNLRCEYLQNPLGIDIKLPRFSWTMASSRRNELQSAFEIVVGTNLAEVQASKGNVWSTGKLVSGQNIQVVYGGKPLQPLTRYYWRVRVYDKEGGVSAWSPVNWFETALLDQANWTAKWISDGSPLPRTDADYYKNDPAPYFRKAFTATKKIASARLYISGLGYYEAFINGKKVGDHVLDAGWTSYKKEVLYVVHDITALLKEGTNVAGVHLGNGWWNPLPFKLFGSWAIRDFQQTGRPCVKAEMHIRYTDGSLKKLVTDESWKTATGPVLRNNVYLGEHYDARNEINNWNETNFPDAQWKNAVPVEGPGGVLTVQMQPPVKQMGVIKPVRITEAGKDTFIADLGQNFAGVARIKVKGPAGTKVTLRLGEGLFKDGSINLMTAVATQIKKGGIKGGPGAPETAWQEDSYVLKGGDTETWAPRFTFHGFRYVEITGWPGKPTVNDIEGVRLHAALEPAGTFASSNEMFNQLHDVIQWTFLSNVFSVQSDCPGREKLGYGADMVVTADAFLYNHNMALFYRKAVHDFANDQQPDGGITETAPYVGIADRGYGGASGPLGWELAFPFLQKKLYDFYGDTRILAESYEGLKKQMAFLQSKAVDGLFHWDISDHESLDPRPEAFTAACFYYHHAKLAEDIAGILGKAEDSLQYNKLSQEIKKAIVKKYWVPHTGRFDLATQAAQVFALWYDLSPDEAATFNVLLDEFARHNGHVSSGIFGVKMMFDVLREADRNETAYRIANQRDFPGWGYMLANGATTLWESWAFPETVYSRNHPMFGSIDEWFYRSLLGINGAAPGFKKIVIKPQPAGDLTWAKGRYQSISGAIASAWKLEGNNFHLQVSIPPNTTAQVWLPAKENSAVQESGQTLKTVRYEKGYAVVDIGSGTYAFQSTR